MHDGAIDASSQVTVDVCAAGYTSICPAVDIPAMPRTTLLGSTDATDTVWSARRDVSWETAEGAGSREFSHPRVPISLKIEATVDEHGSRRVRVSCPTAAVNRSTDSLILQQVRPPRASTFGKGDAAALGLAGSDLRGWAKRRRDRECRVKTPGEGDCWLPAATEIVTLADVDAGEVVRDPTLTLNPPTPRRSHGSHGALGVVAMSSPRKLTESQAHGNAQFGHSQAFSDNFSDTISASASETSLARDSGTNKYNTDDEGVMLGRGRSLVDASVGLSPGGGRIRVYDGGSPVDAVQGRRGSTPNDLFVQDPHTVVNDPGSKHWSPGVAMYGKSPHGNERQSELVVPQFVRLRSPESAHWSAVTRLNPGDRPVVVRVPSILSQSACYEYLVSLRDPLTNAGSVGGTLSVGPRFTVRLFFHSRMGNFIEQFVFCFNVYR